MKEFYAEKNSLLFNKFITLHTYYCYDINCKNWYIRTGLM